MISGAAFGRELVGGTVEVETPTRALGPATLRAAVFADAAKVLAPLRGDMHIDVGAGLRVTPPGWRSALRVDAATPWETMSPRLSAGWQAEWR